MAAKIRTWSTDDKKNFELRENIIKCLLFNEDSEFVKNVFKNIIDYKKKKKRWTKRGTKQLLEENHLSDERAFELEKLKLSCENHCRILTASRL